MGTFTVPNRAVSVPVRPKPAPVQDELALAYDLTTERGCRAYAVELACRTIMIVQLDARTKDAAIQSVSRRYQLGSFLRKLWKNDRVVIRADKLHRLQRAYAEAERSIGRRA